MIKKSEVLAQIRATGLTQSDDELWAIVEAALENGRLQSASLTCRYCKEYGKPDIGHASWLHRTNKKGEALTNPNSCQAAPIWATRLVDDDGGT